MQKIEGSLLRLRLHLVLLVESLTAPPSPHMIISVLASSYFAGKSYTRERFLAVAASCISVLFLWILTLRPSPKQGVISVLHHLYFAGKSYIRGKYFLRKLKTAWKNPRYAQDQFLMRVLKENGDTDYGRKFKLKNIVSAEEFRKRHPLTTYEDYKPYVERVMAGEQGVMTQVMPNAFIQTSGTTGPSKYFPQRDHRLVLTRWLDVVFTSLYEVCPRLGILQKKMFHYVQPVISRAKSGGSIRPGISLYKFKLKNIVSAEEFRKRHPLTTYEDYKPYVERVMAGEQGVMTQVMPNAFIQTSGTTGIPLVNFGYGTSEGMHQGLNPWLYDDNHGLAFWITDSFFEFIKHEDSHENQPKTLFIDELEIGKEYEIVFTQDSGLYRYRVGDVIRITGYHYNCPTFEFMYRMGLMLNLRYEKMNQVVLKAGLQSAVGQWNDVRLVEYAVAESTLIPKSFSDFEENEDMPYYVMFLELDQAGSTSINKETETAKVNETTNSIDRELRDRNSDYERLRREGAISQPRVHIVKPGTFEDFKQYVVKTTNTTANQYKS
eukprot:XP_011684170.1 PREDICTED: indole-3-acetic acid-amido synthetase GH3.3-like [Strongylocentrotus purpuratus]